MLNVSAVGNSLDKCDGLWTRVRNKQKVHEKSVIDYIIIGSFLGKHIVKITIDEEKQFCPFSARGCSITFTDHNVLTAELNLSLEKNFLNHPKKMVWKYSGEGLRKFIN